MKDEEYREKLKISKKISKHNAQFDDERRSWDCLRLAEECAELNKELISWAQRGSNKTTIAAIEEEMGDVIARLHILVRSEKFSIDNIHNRTIEKLEKYEKYRKEGKRPLL